MKKFIRSLVAARLKKLDAEVRRASREPEDPDAVHDVRVAVRRLGQCVRSFEQFFPREAKRIRRRLRKLMDRCGAVRNFDIALEVLKEAGLRDTKMIAGFKDQRARALKDLSRKLHSWRKRHRLHKWRKDLSVSDAPGVWRIRESPAVNARRVLPEQAAEFLGAGQLAVAPGATFHEMHRFRLLGKRFRYTLELFEDVHGEELDPGIAALRGLQDKLGSVNDCATTLELVKSNRNAVAAVRRLAGRRTDEFRKYWSERFQPLEWWNALLGEAVPEQTAKETGGNLHPEAR